MKNHVLNSIVNLDVVIINSVGSHCDPCKMRQPILEKVKEVLSNRITIMHFEAKDYSLLCSRFGIGPSTSLFVLANGLVVWESLRLLSKKELIKIILENT